MVCASNAGGMGLIPGWGSSTHCAVGKKKKEWRHLDISQVVTKMEHSQDDNRIQDGRTVCEPDVNIQRMKESGWITLSLMMMVLS